MIRVVIKSVRPESFIGRTTPTVNRISAVILNLSKWWNYIGVWNYYASAFSTCLPQIEVDVTSMTVRWHLTSISLQAFLGGRSWMHWLRPLSWWHWWVSRDCTSRDCVGQRKCNHWQLWGNASQEAMDNGAFSVIRGVFGSVASLGEVRVSVWVSRFRFRSSWVFVLALWIGS